MTTRSTFTPPTPSSARQNSTPGGVTSTATSGVLYIHSAPRALCPHIEWAVASVLGVRVDLDWTTQPAQAAMWRAELSWRAVPGTAARITSALRGWQQLRFEATEDPAGGIEGERYSSTPELGVYHAATGVHGDIMIPEDRLRAALLRAHRGESTLENEVQALLGKPWDDELEPFRYAGEGAPVRWLHQVG